MAIEYMVKESQTVKDGEHTGTIVEAEENDRSGYEYLDVKIGEIDGKNSDVTLKYSCSTNKGNITKVTKLGKLLMTFGVKLEVGKKASVTDALKIGTKVKFMTLIEPSKKDPNKKFANIVEGSLKPSDGEGSPSTGKGKFW